MPSSIPSSDSLAGLLCTRCTHSTAGLGHCSTTSSPGPPPGCLGSPIQLGSHTRTRTLLEVCNTQTATTQYQYPKTVKKRRGGQPHKSLSSLFLFFMSTLFCFLIFTLHGQRHPLRLMYVPAGVSFFCVHVYTLLPCYCWVQSNPLKKRQRYPCTTPRGQQGISIFPSMTYL